MADDRKRLQYPGANIYQYLDTQWFNEFLEECEECYHIILEALKAYLLSGNRTYRGGMEYTYFVIDEL